MTKEQLLHDLQQETYVALQASPLHGIGVFALRDIRKGCRTIFSKGGNEWIKLSFAEVAQLPSHSRNLVETYCLYDNKNYFVPDYGFKLMDVVLYLNHSDEPNIVSINDGEEFEAIREISEGEELLINYNSIAEGLDY